MLHNIDICYYY